MAFTTENGRVSIEQVSDMLDMDIKDVQDIIENK